MLKVKKINVISAKARCICGECDHKLMEVEFDDGSKWFPTNKEYSVLKEMLQTVLVYNLRNDQYCFKKPQEVNINEVLGK